MTEKFRDRLLAHLLARASHDISRDYLRAVHEQGFTARQWRLLGCLWDEESLTLSELAQVIFCSQSTTTRLVDRLLELGLLKKRMDADDRRKFHVSLSKKGRDSLEPLVALAEAAERRILATLGDERAMGLKAHLEEIIARFGAGNGAEGSPD
jgi:DNA-binding MarR family transcriptional regulator